jgi:hypothetical protein
MPAAENINDIPASLKDISPDPWAEVRKLRHGEDRSFAHVIENNILTAAPEVFPALEKKLLAVLADKRSTVLAKEFVCRMLALVGSEACVDAVAPLLADEQLSHFARIALAPIPGKKADTALRAALPKLSGAEKEGLLGTIAARKNRPPFSKNILP